MARKFFKALGVYEALVGTTYIYDMMNGGVEDPIFRTDLYTPQVFTSHEWYIAAMVAPIAGLIIYNFFDSVGKAIEKRKKQETQ